MPNMDNVVVGGPTLIIMKGEPGTGKSIAAASYSQSGPMFYFDFEDKMDSVKNYYYNTIGKPELVKNLEYKVYRNWDEAWIKLSTFSVQCPYKVLVWDSLTSSAWLAIWGV